METNKIYNEDCLKTLRRMKENSIDLIVMSPPTNSVWYKQMMSDDRGKGNKGMNPKKYEERQKEILDECIRVLKPHGSIYYNHKDIIYRTRLIHPTWIYDYPLRQIIVWDKANTLEKAEENYTPITEYIYWISMSPLLLEEGYTYFKKENSAYKSNIWDVRMDKGSYSPLPLSMVKSMIHSTCPPNGVVYDPFMGGGTTALAVQQLGEGRTFIGSETNKKYCQIAEKRLHDDARQLSLF